MTHINRGLLYIDKTAFHELFRVDQTSMTFIPFIFGLITRFS